MAQGLGANGREGLVLEMEHRRKSGRGVREWYFLPSPKAIVGTGAEGEGMGAGRKREVVVLLEDHPGYQGPEKGREKKVSVLPLSRVMSGVLIKLTTYFRETRHKKAQLLSLDYQTDRGRTGRVLSCRTSMRRREAEREGGFCMTWGVRMTLTRRRMRYEYSLYIPR